MKLRLWIANLRAKCRSLQAGLIADPEIDNSGVGITFIDLLFALVIGFAITPVARWWRIPSAGWFHLVTAVLLTLTSWIGYHNSRNKPLFVIGFTNLPFVQFILDVSMVVVYAFTVFTAEGITRGATRYPAVIPEALLVLFTFFLYHFWDKVVAKMRTADAYQPLWEKIYKDRPELAPNPENEEMLRKRSNVTVVCLKFAFAVAVAAIFIESRGNDVSTSLNFAINAALWAIILGFRFAKVYFTPTGQIAQPSETI